MFSSKSSTPALGPTQPTFHWVPGAERQGRELNHSLPSSAEVKNEWSYTSTPSICLHAVDKDNRTFISAASPVPFPVLLESRGHCYSSSYLIRNEKKMRCRLQV
jgi:hypothetical protein